MNTLCAALMLITSTAGDKKLPVQWDFEDATIGKLPAGWSAPDLGKQGLNAWKVQEDKTAPKGPKVLAQTSAAGSSAIFNLCVHDKTQVADLDLSVALKAIAGKKDQGGGPVWRYRDAKNYYVVRMNPLEDNFRLYKVVDGKRIQLASADIAAAAGTWHTIRVVQKGNHIQCYLNGKLHLDEKDDAFKDAGKIGLWTKADAQTYFDMLVISKPGG